MSGTFKIQQYDPSREEDVKAEARVRALFALRKAWKERSSKDGLKAAELAAAVGKDKGYVSRLLNGRTNTVTLETLAVFLDALGYHLPLKPVRTEDLPRANFDAKSRELSRSPSDPR